MVADGRLEGTIVKRNSHDWDLAAADLILERAGGALVDLFGHPLAYNRVDVSHGELCGAPAARLPEFSASSPTDEMVDLWSKSRRGRAEGDDSRKRRK